MCLQCTLPVIETFSILIEKKKIFLRYHIKLLCFTNEDASSLNYALKIIQIRIENKL